MLQGFVAGELWSSTQVPALAGSKLLLVQPEASNPSQQELVAVDLVGAGVGDRVLVALGQAARNALNKPDAPIEAAIIAVIDDLRREVPLAHDHRGVPAAEIQVEPRGRKLSLKKKAKKRTIEPADETLDLFPGISETESSDSEASDTLDESEAPDLPSKLPSIDDVDRIWGDTEEEESTS
ncbi:MAG: ethanolamine utilization protein EutN [Planctomycetota bacterium]|jgi:ethanolamine utilization protein EutN